MSFDALCERINLCTPVRCVIGLEGGLVTGVTANVDLEFVVLDYDVEGCDDDEVMTVPSLWVEDKVIDVYKRGFYDADLAPEPVERLHAAIEAIMEAGGFDFNKASLKDVPGVRHENGNVKNFKLNLKNALEGKPTEPFYLKPSDIVYVKERFVFF